MDTNLTKRIEEIEKKNKELKRLVYIIFFNLVLFSILVIYKKDYVFFEDTDSGQFAKYGLNGVRVSEGDNGVNLNTYSLDLVTHPDDSKDNLGSSVRLQNNKDNSSLFLRNSGSVTIQTGKLPMIKISTEHKGWFRVQFTEDGEPQLAFGSKDRNDNFTLSIDDLRKLKSN